MPQASDEQRAAWGGAQGVGDDKATGFLEARGYVLTQDWLWKIPEGHEPTQEEIEACAFLIDEWDFGGFTP